MNISLPQRLSVFVIKLFISFFSFIETVERAFIRFFQANIISLSFLFFLYFVTNTGSLFQGLLSNLYFRGYVSDKNILGASDTQNLGPISLGKIDKPEISARAAIAVDVLSDKVLFDFNSNDKLAPASTTKLMTALISLDIYSLDDKLKTPAVCVSIESQKAGLYTGMKLSVKDLVYTLLIGSAGDSACVLSLGSTSYDDFVNLMNKKAKKIGMENSNFTNPIGLDGENGSHYSSAADLYKLAKYAVKNDTVRDIISTKEYTFSDTSKNLKFKIFNTNKLLWEIPETVGIKTGTTQDAGEVLIYEYKSGNKDIVIIVMGSGDRFFDTKVILNWVLASYLWG